MANKGIIVVTPPDINPSGVRSKPGQETNEDLSVFFGEKKEEQKEPEKKEEPVKPDPDATETKPPKKEEPGPSIDDKLKRLKESLGYVSRKKPEAKEENGAEPAAQKAEPEKAEVEPEEKKEDAKESKVTKRPSRNDLLPGVVESAVTAATKAAMEASRPHAPREAAPSEPDLTGEDARDYKVMKRLESDMPEKYRGLSKKFLRYVEDLKTYRTQWERDHRGESFDPDASEHSKFFEQYEPQYDPEDFDEAKFNLRADSLKQKWEAEQNEKLSKVEEKLVEFELHPKIRQAVGAATNDFVRAVDPKAAEILSTKGMDALKAEDEIAFDVMDNMAVGLNQAVAEIERLSHPSGKYKFNPNNQTHQMLERVAGIIEQRTKELPIEEQVRDGKLFATNHEFNNMPAEQRSRYWSLSYDLLKQEIIKDAAQTAKKIIDAERQKIEKYVKSKGLSAAKTSQTQDAQKPEKQPVSSPKAKSPAAATEQVTTPKVELEKPQVGPAVQNLLDNMFKRNV